MASATITATISGAAASLLVIYPHAGITDADLKAELLVIKGWFIAFNSDVAVCYRFSFLSMMMLIRFC